MNPSLQLRFVHYCLKVVELLKKLLMIEDGYCFQRSYLAVHSVIPANNYCIADYSLIG